MAKISDHPTLGTRDDASYLEVVSSGVNKKQTPAVLLAGYATETYADTAASSAQSAAQTYTDGKVAGLSWKQAVRAATTANGTLATAFENGDSLDGVTLATGDRILIKNQSSASENGIYTVNASGAPTRATDADAGSELVNATVYISEGTTQADTQWTCTTNAPITINSTSLAFAQLSTGSGTVTSVDASGGVQTTSGSAISTTGTIRGAHVINAQSGTSYAILAADRGKHITVSNASSIAGTIAQAGTTGFEDGFFTVVENIGVGAFTLTPTTSTINGASAQVLNSGQSAIIFSDGTNYRAIVINPSGIAVNAQTGTSYTYLSGDFRKLVTHSNGSAIAGTLPQATGAFGAGWYMWVENRGAGTLTITPITSTIDGAASLALTTNQGCLIASDGTNYFTMRGVGATGAITSSGLTMATNKVLGRTTASAGSVEEISIGTGLSLSGGTLSSTVVAAARVLLESHTASNSASLDFTTRNAAGQSGATIQSDYDEYEIEFINIVHATDNTKLKMVMSTNGGSSYDTGGNYHWAHWRFIYNGSGSTGNNSDSAIFITDIVDTGVGNYSLNGSAKLFNPGGSIYKAVTGKVMFRDNGAALPLAAEILGVYLSTTAVNAFQFLLDSGNITSGTIRVYGVAK